MPTEKSKPEKDADEKLSTALFLPVDSCEIFKNQNTSDEFMVAKKLRNQLTQNQVSSQICVSLPQDLIDDELQTSPNLEQIFDNDN